MSKKSSDLGKFNRAVVESFAPLLRDALRGVEINEDEAQDRLERQLRGRGFDIKETTEKEENRD